LSRQGGIIGMPKIESLKVVCERCLTRTHHRENFAPTNKNHAKNVLQLIHVDLGGPILKETLDLSKHFLVFTDDYSWKTWVCFLCAKSETFAKFKIFKELVKCKIGKKIGAL
jgi:hypothetical protein